MQQNHLSHTVAQGMLLMTISKVDLYVQFYIQDPYVDLVASGKLHTVISVVYCCIVHGTPLIDKERLGLKVSFGIYRWHT